MRGAEARLRKIKFLGRDAVVKERVAKKYRIIGIDKKLRTARTRVEARLLHKAKLAGISCPVVFEVGEFEIIMSAIPGSRPKMDEKQCLEAGFILARLHRAGIIHGDYTPANLITEKNKISVIDFGLGFVSNDVEDKAVDFYTMIRSVGYKDAFTRGYERYERHQLVLERVKKIEKRVRYATN